MPKSKPFRIAVEGGTTDGRVIEREWIEQMAATYNPATYTARVNCEHIRGFSPEPPFNGYGDVVALSTKEVELELGGKTEKRLALYAVVDANDQLVQVRKKGQKPFPSIEVNPNFSSSGKAYLMGLGMTDTPASLGTEIMQFAAANPTANPFAGRKLAAGNLFSAAFEAVELEFEEAEAPKLSALEQFAAAFAAFVGKPAEQSKPEPKPEPKPGATGGDFSAAFAGLTDALKQDRAADRETADARFAQIERSIADLTIKLAGEPAGAPARPAVSGSFSGTGSVQHVAVDY